MSDPVSSPGLSHRQQWEALERTFPGVGFVLDDEGRFVEIIASDDADSLLYDDRDDLLGETLHGVFPADRADYFLERITRALETDEVQHVEYRLDVKAGTRWFEAHVVPVRPADGDASYVQVLTRDVTDRKTRERELRRYERRFEAVFEDPNILVGLLDPDGTLIDVNRTALDYLDADLEAVTGQPFWETPWFTGDEALQAEVERLSERAAAGEYVEFELDLSGAVGRPLVISGVFRPVVDDDGDVVSVIVSDRDVTSHERRERELRRSKRQFEAVFDDPHVLLGILDADGRLRRANRTAMDLVDAEADDVAGVPFWETPWWSHSEALQTDLRRWIERATEGEYVEFDAEHVTVDGERILVDGFIQPVADDDGDVVSLIVSAHDVTSRHRHQQRLQVLHRVLRHNLRNSLNTIQGYAEELRTGSGGGAADAELETRARAIEAEATELAELVTKIRKFKRIEEASTGRTVAVEELFADVVAAADAAEPDCTVETTVPPGSVEVPRAVELAVFEAVENALEHHVDGGVPAVELSARVDREATPSQVTIGITDDGPGIPRAELDPLETGWETALHHASSVGLWLMKWTVESQGGELALVETSDRGSTVEITVPLDRRADA